MNQELAPGGLSETSRSSVKSAKFIVVDLNILW